MDSRLTSTHLHHDERLPVFIEARTSLIAARGIITTGWEELETFCTRQELPSLLPGTRLVLYDNIDLVSYRLKVGLNTVGRYASNDIVVEHRSVSRRHCTILVHARGGCELHDTASQNGTFRNGFRVREPVDIRPGDLIQLARCLFTLRADEGADPLDDCPPTESG